MKNLRFWALCLLGLLLTALPANSHQILRVSTEQVARLQPAALQQPIAPPTGDRSIHLRNERTAPVKRQIAQRSPRRNSSNGSDSEMQPFDQVIQGAEKLLGLFTLYRNPQTNKTYLEIQPNQFNQNFLCVTTLEAGIGEGGLYSGWPLRDFLFQFRRVNDTVQLVVPNTYFRTEPGDPQQRSVQRSFSDSVLFSLKIHSIHPDRQSLLIDLSDLILGGRDLSGIVSELSFGLGDGYSIDSEVSHLGTVEAFPQNVEIEAIYGFSGGGGSTSDLPTLPDPRAFNLGIRYSFSQLPVNNGYRPRLADDRVGYFITAYQDLSNRDRAQPFVRYIQRWNLEKQDPSQSLSPPKEPIVFWIENSVPEEYREGIRDGILMWNSAFEKAGFQSAIEVRQMPDDADWDSADVRYNTIRWSNSFRPWAIALGPSRVNPLTGQILDADIIIDANAVRFLQENAGTLIQAGQSADAEALSPILGSQLCTPRLGQLYLQWMETQPETAAQAPWMAMLRRPESSFSAGSDLCFGMESAQQVAFGTLSLATVQNILPSSDAMRDFVYQYLRYLTAHEVGHTLGLRHNFRGSTMLPPEDLHNTEITHTKGLVGSVMDYVPVNLAPPESQTQGDYFPTILGPYDRWAIEYGYMTVDSANLRAEQQALQQIAQRSTEPGLSYATDEDTMDSLDPGTNVWDLSGNMLHYSEWQMNNALNIWQRLGRRYPLPGESYSELRDRFDTVFYYYVGYALTPARYIGGQTFNRDRRTVAGGRPPFEPISLEQQREALSILRKYVFSEEAFKFSPELINQLAPSRWQHWGSSPPIFRLDYPIYDNILTLQSIVLSDLLSSERLARLRDGELRTNPGQALTLAELFSTLQSDIWTEIVQDDQDLTEISSLRRGLQRQYMEILINMTLRTPPRLESISSFVDFIIAIQTANPPEDARVLARYHLRELQDDVETALRRHGRDMELTTKAHLEEAHDRITKALDAQLIAD